MESTTTPSLPTQSLSTQSRNIKLVLSYDGSGFSGWQRQKDERSVQEELEKALARLHGHEVVVAGAGRTDSGVHARGQVAGFKTDMAGIKSASFTPALNSLLPADVRILSSEEAHPDFHVRFDAILRRYRYFVLCGAQFEPYRLRYAHRLARVPDIRSLNAMAGLILGERDFTAFSSARDSGLSRHRYVYESSFFFDGDTLVYQVSANAFLLRMVRSLVGSMLQFERESRSPAEAAARMGQVLASADRSLAGTTAPAKGLFLWNVEYCDKPGSRDIFAFSEGIPVGSGSPAESFS